MSEKRQWGHSSLADHARCLEVPTVSAATLTQERFFSDWVAPLKPCRIAGAVDPWPARRLWTSSEYLMDRIGADREVIARTHPAIEYPMVTTDGERLDRQNAETQARMPFGEFMRRAQAPSSGHFVLHSYPIKRRAFQDAEKYPLRPPHALSSMESVCDPLSADVTGFPFLRDARPPREYHAYRVFVFRNSYTDWHYHSTDETLMCQVAGRKEVLLMPPDEETWSIVWPIMKKHGCTFGHEGVAQQLAGGTKYRIVVEPGDALYIPPLWWHSVEAMEDHVGVTVAACFRTAFASAVDLRYPAGRRLVKDAITLSTPRNVVKTAALLAAAVAACEVRRGAQKAMRALGRA